MVWTSPHSPPKNSLPTPYRPTPRPDHVGAPPDSNKKGTVSGPDRAAPRTSAFYDLTAGRKEQRLSNRESEPRASKPARGERERRVDRL